MNLRKLISWKDALTYRQKVVGLVLCGLIVGLGLLFAYLLRLHEGVSKVRFLAHSFFFMQLSSLF